MIQEMAIKQELEEQRNWALTRCAMLRAEAVKAEHARTEAEAKIERLKAEILAMKGQPVQS